MDPKKKRPQEQGVGPRRRPEDMDASLADELESDGYLDEWGAEDLLGRDIDIEDSGEWGSA